MEPKQAQQIERFRRRLHETFEKGKKERRLAGIGSFAIVIHKVVAWTVYTSGPRMGIHEELGDDVLDFVMVAKLDMFLEMYGAESWKPIDVNRALTEKRLGMHGDLNVYLSFLRINEAKDMISLRAG